MLTFRSPASPGRTPRIRGLLSCPRILLAVALLALSLGAAQAGKESRLQMRFGVDMARRGSWKEAQYRFERALAVAPQDARVLNNLAVAYENNGHYARAQQIYLQALEHGPDNEKIRANYERFRIFYTDHLSSLQEQKGEESPEASDEDSQDG